jgi:hypothetical protein
VQERMAGTGTDKDGAIKIMRLKKSSGKNSARLLLYPDDLWAADTWDMDRWPNIRIYVLYSLHWLVLLLLDFNIDFWYNIWPFILFKIIYYISNLFSNKINHNKIYNFSKIF